MSNIQLTGSCLCKSVAYEIKGNLDIFQYCNCSSWLIDTGNTFGSVDYNVDYLRRGYIKFNAQSQMTAYQEKDLTPIYKSH